MGNKLIALAMAAHPDDIEFMMAGTLLLLKQAGWETHYLNLSAGNCGSVRFGPAETAQVRDLVTQLKEEGIGIFLISHDIHDVYDLSDRISVMLQGKLVDTVVKDRVTKDEILAMIIMGKKPGEVTQTELAELHS